MSEIIISGGSGAVASVFGRTGVVVSESGDYTAAQVTGAEQTANKNQANGYAGLDSTGNVPASELANSLQAIVQSGLLAEYRMTDSGGSDGFTLTDSSVNANNGTLGDMAPITNLSLTLNVITITAANDYVAGQVVVLKGLTTNPTLNGQSLTVLSSGLSSSQFKANLTNANIGSSAETGYAVITATAPVWIAGTGGLKFTAASKQFASLPSALNGAKTMMLVTFLTQQRRTTSSVLQSLRIQGATGRTSFTLTLNRRTRLAARRTIVPKLGTAHRKRTAHRFMDMSY